MKKSKNLLLSFAVLFAVTFITSCSTDDDGCNCVKTSYEFDQYATTGTNGLPVMTFDKIILSEENVPCQDEQGQTSAGNNVYYDINCN